MQAVDKIGPMLIPDHTSIPMWNVLAEELNLLQAGLLHRVLEVYVFTEADLLIKQSCTAYAAELVTTVL